MARLRYQTVTVNGKKYKAIKGFGTMAEGWGGEEVAVVANTLGGLKRAWDSIAPHLIMDDTKVCEVIILRPQNQQRLEENH